MAASISRTDDNTIRVETDSGTFHIAYVIGDDDQYSFQLHNEDNESLKSGMTAEQQETLVKSAVPAIAQNLDEISNYAIQILDGHSHSDTSKENIGTIRNAMVLQIQNRDPEASATAQLITRTLNAIGIRALSASVAKIEDFDPEEKRLMMFHLLNDHYMANLEIIDAFGENAALAQETEQIQARIQILDFKAALHELASSNFFGDIENFDPNKEPLNPTEAGFINTFHAALPFMQNAPPDNDYLLGLNAAFNTLPPTVQNAIAQSVNSTTPGLLQTSSQNTEQQPPRGEITDAQLANIHSFIKPLGITPGDRDTLNKDVDAALTRFSALVAEKSSGFITFNYTPGTGYTAASRTELVKILSNTTVQDGLKGFFPAGTDISAKISSVIADLDDASKKGFFSVKPGSAIEQPKIKYPKPFRQAVMAVEQAFINRNDGSFVQKADGYYDPATQKMVQDALVKLIEESDLENPDIEAMTAGILLDSKTIEEKIRPSEETVKFLEETLKEKHEELTEAQTLLDTAQRKLDKRINDFFKDNPDLKDAKEQFRNAIIASKGKEDVFADSDIAKNLKKEKPENYDDFLFAVLSMQGEIEQLSNNYDNLEGAYKETRALTSLIQLMAKGQQYSPDLIDGIHGQIEHVNDNILSLGAYEIIDNMGAGHTIAVSLLYDDEDSEQGKAVLKEFAGKDLVTRGEIYDFVRKQIDLRFLIEEKEIKEFNGKPVSKLTREEQNDFIEHHVNKLKDMSQAILDGTFIPYTYNPRSAGFSGIPKDAQLMYKSLETPGLKNPEILNIIKSYHSTRPKPDAYFALNTLKPDQLIALTGRQDFNDLGRREQIDALTAVLSQPIDGNMSNPAFRDLISLSDDRYADNHYAMVGFALRTMTAAELANITGQTDFRIPPSKEQFKALKIALNEPIEKLIDNPDYRRLVMNYYEDEMGNFSRYRNGPNDGSEPNTWNSRYGTGGKTTAMQTYIFENGIDFDALYGKHWEKIFEHDGRGRTNPALTYEQAKQNIEDLNITAAEKQKLLKTLNDGIANTTHSSVYTLTFEMHPQRTRQRRREIYLQPRNIKKHFEEQTQPKEPEVKSGLQKAHDDAVGGPGDTSQQEQNPAPGGPAAPGQ